MPLFAQGNMNSTAWSLSNPRLLFFFATFYRHLIPCENQRGFLADVPLYSMLTPTQCLRKEMLIYKTSTPATFVSPKWSHETNAYKWYTTETGVPAPLNRVEGSRLTLTYSTMLNSTWAPSKTNVNQTPSAVRQRPRFYALSLAGRTVNPASYPQLSGPIDCQSQLTVNILHPLSVVENAEQQTTLKALPTLRK